ncbi:uncharacterized protein LOC111273003 [Varroa jacobsoni]|uniref:uncharacterized protein LOC111273003 n=1 Tax=Varroa jacobsoni TaxID=62625 RepID=UPI000BF6545A|nr:uncharacterized protein LOC111273003 [Varroa jacobsoni]
MEQSLKHVSRKFSIEERFQWRSEEERHLIDKALERAMEEDIEICSSDGQLVRSHRCILAAASPFFHSMFKSGMRECRGQVDLHFSSELLASLMRFLYEGRFEVSDSTFEQTFLMYHLFELRAALAFIGDLMSDTVECDNALELYDTAINFGIPQLRTSVVEFLLSVPIFEVPFDKFPFDLLAVLLDRDELRVEHEGQVVELIFAWVNADADSRKIHQDALLHHVRLPHLRLSEVDSFRNQLAHLDLFNLLTESNDWLADVGKKMLSKRVHSDVHLHGFWAEDSLCEYSFEAMRRRKVEQPLWMFDTSRYFMMCSFLGKQPKIEIESCNQDYLSTTSLDGLIIREDWTKRPSYVLGPELHITLHDSLRRVADMKSELDSPDYDIVFLKVPIAQNGVTSRRSECKRRAFIFDFYRARVCCVTEHDGEAIFIVGSHVGVEDEPDVFLMRICRYNPRIEPRYGDGLQELTCDIELTKDYVPVCCLVTENKKLVVVSLHDIKIYSLQGDSQETSHEFSISLEFEIGVTAWIKQDTLYVYLVDRMKDVFDSTDGEEEPPKMHFISGYSISNNFDKIFQHRLDFQERKIGYPKDIRSIIIRDTIYIMYKPIPQYRSPLAEGFYIYRYDEDLQTMTSVDRFEVLRKAKCDRFPTNGAIYERDLVTLLPTDMMRCEHTTLLEEFCHRCSLDEALEYDPVRLALLRKYLV